MTIIPESENTRSEYICHMPGEILSDDEIRPFLEEIHEIDITVYSPEDAGEVTPMVSRYIANPESYVYVRDRSGKLVGYINFFPVDDDLRKMIISAKTPYEMLDDGIKATQVNPYEKEHDNFIFILSAAILSFSFDSCSSFGYGCNLTIIINNNGRLVARCPFDGCVISS